MSIFTHDEQTKKKYKVQDAVTAAKFILTENRINTINTNCISTIPEDALFTLVELNAITNNIVRDTRGFGR